MFSSELKLVVWSVLLISVQSDVQLSKPSSDERIVGGDLIVIKDVPYQVSVLKAGKHICGGALLSKRFVLSAAHCFIIASTYSIHVRIGSSLKNSGGRLVEVSNVIAHELYDRFTTDYDFALLQLNKFDKKGLIWGTVQLPTPNQPIAGGTICTVSGWGSTQSPTTNPDNLHAVDVAVYNQNYCRRVYRSIGYGVTDRMMCAGYVTGGRDACQGDSGGPLMMNGTLVGVVSWGFECAKSQYPGVYARVSSVRQWIGKVTGL